MADVKLGRSLSASPGNLVRLGCALMMAGKGAEAVVIVERTLEEHPDDPEWREAARAVLSYGVPGFHRSMLADAPRNDFYAQAIRATVRPGDVVLDIGTGSGLLAMLAAQAGAARVVACEANPALAATAREIVRRNGFADRIEILASKSTALDRSEALAGGADVIVSEIFSHTLIDEGAIESLNHGMQALARPGARIIPESASVEISLVDYSGDTVPPVDRVAAFDVGLFDRHMPASINVPTKSRHLQLRSASRSLFDFDFTGGEAPAEGRRTLALESGGGRVTGVVQWIALRQRDGLAFENAPGRDIWSHWPCVVYPFDKPLETSAREEVRVEGWHDGLRLMLWR
ncbi:MAG TPA: 50S ribosomal protein L11 methyltransferase [Allosphingosinicella sp.]